MKKLIVLVLSVIVLSACSSTNVTRDINNPLPLGADVKAYVEGSVVFVASESMAWEVYQDFSNASYWQEDFEIEIFWVDNYAQKGDNYVFNVQVGDYLMIMTVTGSRNFVNFSIDNVTHSVKNASQ